MGRYEIEAEKEIESLQKWMLEARDDRDRCMEEIETLKAGREEAVKLVLDAGLSTGHADTCGVDMNKREAAIVTAYTGRLIGSFSDFHEYVEEVFERPVFTHELGDRRITDKLKELSKPDFISIPVG